MITLIAQSLWQLLYLKAYQAVHLQGHMWTWQCNTLSREPTCNMSEHSFKMSMKHSPHWEWNTVATPFRKNSKTCLTSWVCLDKTAEPREKYPLSTALVNTCIPRHPTPFLEKMSLLSYHFLLSPWKFPSHIHWRGGFLWLVILWEKTSKLLVIASFHMPTISSYQ